MTFAVNDEIFTVFINTKFSTYVCSLLQQTKSIELYWYNEMQIPVRSTISSCLHLTDHHILVTKIEMEKGISNTWRMIIHNRDLLLKTNSKTW